MTRYLFLVSSGKLNDGGLVLNRQLSEALARGNDVHLATIGPCEQRREGVHVVELDETLLSQGATDDIHQTRHFVDRFSKTIRAVLDEQGPERVGLPTDAGAFDVIVGYGDVTGPAALHLRDTYYPDAKVSTVITMDPKGLFKALDLPELGEHRTENHRKVLASSDLILAHGPKSAVDARRLAAEWPRAESLPPTHEFVPGVETAQDTPARWQPGEPFNVLMLGRMHDVNKGAADVALAVAGMRARGFENVHLTLRGVGAEESDELNRQLNGHFAGDRWRSFVTVEEFTSDEAEKERSIRESQVLVMATESEAYGLAASEYAAQGRPLIVAEGNGNGFATFLRDQNRIPSDIADRFVLDDSGSLSVNGSLMGAGHVDTAVPRHRLIAERLKDVHNDYDSYVDAAGRLRGHLNEYTLDHTAASIDQAVNDNLTGNIRHTKQGPRGVNVVPSEEELLQGIPEGKRDLILDPREASPRRSIQGTVASRGPAEAEGRTAAPSSAGGQQSAAASDAQPLSFGGTSTPGPDPALADRVVVNDLLAQRGHREASRFDMLIAGMGEEEISAAISSWEELGKPETAREREVRLRAEQTTPEATERTQQAVEVPEPSREEPQTPPGRPVQDSEHQQTTDTETQERTASAIWETPKPPLKSMATHRTEWALYDDLHGYGRCSQRLSVKAPSKEPGVYEALLHPNTSVAYERDRRQAERCDRGYGE